MGRTKTQNGGHSPIENSPSVKSKQSAKISSDVQAFLDKGGVMDVIASDIDSSPKARMGFSTSQGV